MAAIERPGVGSVGRDFPPVDETALFRFTYLLAVTGQHELYMPGRLDLKATLKQNLGSSLLAACRANPEAGIVGCLVEMVPARLLRHAAETAEAIARSMTPSNQRLGQPSLEPKRCLGPQLGQGD